MKCTSHNRSVTSFTEAGKQLLMFVVHDEAWLCVVVVAVHVIVLLRACVHALHQVTIVITGRR